MMQAVNQEEVSVEREILGCILVEPALIDECPLSADDFFSPQSQSLYRAYRKIMESGKPINPVSIAKVMGDHLKFIGGFDYLQQLANSIATTADFKFYVETVRENAACRQAKKVMGSALMEMDFDKIGDVAQKLENIAQSNHKEKKKTTIQLLSEVYESLFEDKGDLLGVTTGSADLNRMTGGLHEGELIIVAARPSIGKTAFSFNIALKASKSGVIVDYFSLEMPERSMIQRAVSSLSGVSMSEWTKSKHQISDKTAEMVSGAIDQYSHDHPIMHDEEVQNVQSIRAAVRKSIQKYPDQKHLVIIDYLQIMSSIGRFDNRNNEIGGITRALKRLARGFKVPVVLLSQLSREVEKRNDKRPMMSDLRDSGSIEQDADVVMLLYRDEYYHRNTKDKNIMEINVAKQRNGATGTIKMYFDRAKQIFLDLKYE